MQASISVGYWNFDLLLWSWKLSPLCKGLDNYNIHDILIKLGVPFTTKLIENTFLCLLYNFNDNTTTYYIFSQQFRNTDKKSKLLEITNRWHSSGGVVLGVDTNTSLIVIRSSNSSRVEVKVRIAVDSKCPVHSSILIYISGFQGCLLFVSAHNNLEGVELKTKITNCHLGRQ